ncbi:MAG: endolytic transglycosylase MltG [Chloroflexi bacterium]|nr:endolytic transglycosylase MltG [Chloroflexota bacterium]
MRGEAWGVLRLVLPLAAIAGAVLLVAGAPQAAARALRSERGAATVAQLSRAVTFTVEPGTPAATIAQQLRDAGVLAGTRELRVLLQLSGGGADLLAGCYVFETGTPAAEVLRRLRSGITATQLLAVPEGRRLEEVGTILERAGITGLAQWVEAVDAAPRELLPQPLPAGATLLGYLLPASYPLQCTTGAPQMVAAMLEAFAAQVTPELIAEAEAAGLTLHEVVTLASIVEREAAIRNEQPLVASVFLNRLREGIPLQADPTVQFAIASEQPPTGEQGWWKRELSIDDLAFASPYNTYLKEGLPPGPIANPGIDAIVAVIRPAETDYLYFAARGDGSHAFARTLAEHNANVSRYLR